jgi:hypothetical protein
MMSLSYSKHTSLEERRFTFPRLFSHTFEDPWSLRGKVVEIVQQGVVQVVCDSAKALSRTVLGTSLSSSPEALVTALPRTHILYSGLSHILANSQDKSTCTSAMDKDAITVHEMFPITHTAIHESHDVDTALLSRGRAITRAGCEMAGWRAHDARSATRARDREHSDS